MIHSKRELEGDKKELANKPPYLKKTRIAKFATTPSVANFFCLPLSKVSRIRNEVTELMSKETSNKIKRSGMWNA